MKILERLFVPQKSMSDQVRDYCRACGWDETATNTAVETAIEICGVDGHISQSDLRSVLNEVCRQG